MFHNTVKKRRQRKKWVRKISVSWCSSLKLISLEKSNPLEQQLVFINNRSLLQINLFIDIYKNCKKIPVLGRRQGYGITV